MILPPQQLLCYDRRSLWKRIYRILIDGLEDVSMGCANVIAVNSSMFSVFVRCSVYLVILEKVKIIRIYFNYSFRIFQ